MPSDVSKLSPLSLRRLIDRAGAEYDTVLIDTGPVPGSLEASVVSAAADGVVMVVSRGEHRPMAERSLQHLRSIGAHVAGMVFNRAEGRDMSLTSTTNRLSSFDRSGRVSAAAAEITEAVESPRFGPVAMAVAGRKSGKSKTPFESEPQRPR
jgi:Mrp family chromosome partitioning ATPase